MSRVTVVGGGLAGIAAALELAGEGVEVTLYEARNRLGGATFSFERNGLWLDNGQHVALRCCSEYLAFLRRLGVDDLLPLQPRLRVPVLREGKPRASIARAPLPAPLHLAGTLLRYAPLSLRERLAALRAAQALQKLDPDDPALDRETFAAWLRRHGQSDKAITSLWNLIALPTLNLPADEASLAGAVKVFRTGLLDSADGSDIGVPAVPFQRLHADPAAAALQRAGARVHLGAAVRPEDLVVFLGNSDAVIAAIPHTAAGELLPPEAVDAESLAGLGTSPIVNLHIHYDRPVLDEPLAAALDSPVQWLFDRTRAAGAREGQLVAVSLSSAVDEIGRPVAALREKFLPAVERLLPAARGAQVLDFAVTHEPRATFPARGDSGREPAPRSAGSTSQARGRTRPGPRPWRAPSAAAWQPRAPRSTTWPREERAARRVRRSRTGGRTRT
jgi:squalene-associated FAD-dependent desaturase